jgi:plastocyanin
MKFSRVAALSMLSGLSIASSDYTTGVGCTVAPPSTVYKTVTVTTAAVGTQVSVSQARGATTVAPYVTTANGMVTSCDYHGGSSTVYVYPTGSGNYDATQAVYNENGIVVQINIITINITINNGQTSTVTITKTDNPTSTPTPPPNSSTESKASYTGTRTKSTTHTGTGSTPSATHSVTVGKGGALMYDPPYVSASNGDTIRFIFFAKNHTLTSSEFASPCTKNGVFDTGFTHATPSDNITTSIDFPVTGTSKPLWFYCRQTGHCSKGMVFAINPKSPQQFTDFRNAALATANSTTNSTSSGVASPTNMPKPVMLNGRRGLPWGA